MVSILLFAGSKINYCKESGESKRNFLGVFTYGESILYTTLFRVGRLKSINRLALTVEIHK